MGDKARGEDNHLRWRQSLILFTC